jgi:flagellar hook-associated protein FlgK
VFSQSGIGQLGTGVEVTQISRARDTFIDGQVRN